MTDTTADTDPPFVPTTIVSGGQTGVDRAALEVAMALGIAHGGWCPKGRLSEDGTVPSRYELLESHSSDYRVRTEQNVIDSDATLILYEGRLKGGTSLTAAYSRHHDKPHLIVRLDRDDPQQAQGWLREVRPQKLNVAGPRETSNPGIFDRAMAYLLTILCGP